MKVELDQLFEQATSNQINEVAVELKEVNDPEIDELAKKLFSLIH